MRNIIHNSLDRAIVTANVIKTGKTIARVYCIWKTISRTISPGLG